MFKQYQFRNYRIKLVILVYLLTTIGILIIGSAEKSFQSQQIIGLVLGSAAMLVCSLTDYNIFMNLPKLEDVVRTLPETLGEEYRAQVDAILAPHKESAPVVETSIPQETHAEPTKPVVETQDGGQVK